MPEYEKREGPPVKAKKHADAFKKAHKNAYEKKSRLYADVKREYRKPEDLAKDLVKDEYMKDKIKKINLCK